MLGVAYLMQGHRSAYLACMGRPCPAARDLLSPASLEAPLLRVEGL